MEKEEKISNFTVCLVVSFFVVFWILVLEKLSSEVFWLLMGYEGVLLLAFGLYFWTGCKEIENERIEKQQQEKARIQAAQRSTQLVKQEEDRIKAIENDKKIQREHLAKLLDEL